MEKKHFGNLEIRVFNDLEELSRGAAEIFATECKKTLKTKEIFTQLEILHRNELQREPLNQKFLTGFTISLCGGSTPKRLFELLATDFKEKISCPVEQLRLSRRSRDKLSQSEPKLSYWVWQKVHIFWGDEREKKESTESNFQIAYKIWLKKIIQEIPSFKNNIHRIKTELGLNKGANDYEKEINKFASEGFDLSFNGVGSDGHRNGVFPENPNWKNGIWDLPESVKVYGYKVPPEINPHTERITLTPWFLNKSKVNILLIYGEEKSELLRKITINKENYNKRDLPAITFNDVPTIVLSDKKAASKI